MKTLEQLYVRRYNICHQLQWANYAIDNTIHKTEAQRVLQYRLKQQILTALDGVDLAIWLVEQQSPLTMPVERLYQQIGLKYEKVNDQIHVIFE